jgi:hypothetical protein
MHAKLLVQRPCIVANDLETAALGWSFWAESADDHISSRLHCAGHLADVGETVARRGKNPVLLNQRGLNTCGPAVFFRIWFARDPVAAADFACSLLMTGSATIGSLKVTAGWKLLGQRYAILRSVTNAAHPNSTPEGGRLDVAQCTPRLGEFGAGLFWRSKFSCGIGRGRYRARNSHQMVKGDQSLFDRCGRYIFPYRFSTPAFYLVPFRFDPDHERRRGSSSTFLNPFAREGS